MKVRDAVDGRLSKATIASWAAARTLSVLIARSCSSSLTDSESGSLGGLGVCAAAFVRIRLSQRFLPISSCTDHCIPPRLVDREPFEAFRKYQVKSLGRQGQLECGDRSLLRPLPLVILKS